MSIQKLPSGRYRAQVYNPATGRNVSVSKILGLQGRDATFVTKREAKAAREKARERLNANPRSTVTVDQWRDRWLNDPLFRTGTRGPRKDSTIVVNAQRTKPFADRYGAVPLDHVSDFIVAQYLAGGRRNYTVPGLYTMFADAASPRAGRLIQTNPFHGLGLGKGKGNAEKQPPPEEQMWAMVKLARTITPPSFADYLEVGCFTAMRPGELDALDWPSIDFDAGEIHVLRQWSAKTRQFSTPKYGAYTMALVNHARTVLGRMAKDGDFVFMTLRGNHYTPSSRNHHWNRVRCAAGLPDMTLYLATRHYFGYYALNVLELEPSVIATQLGHKDGGRLVEQLYGHRDRKRSLQKIRDAFADTGQVHPLRVVREDGA